MASGTIDLEEERVLDAQTLGRRAQFALTITRYVLGAAVIILVLTVILWLFSQPYTQLLVAAGFMVPLLVSAVLYPGLYRRGQATVGIQLYLLSLLLVLAVLPALIPNTMLTVAIAYVVTIAAVYLLLGGKRSRWLIGATMLAFIADLILVDFLAPRWFTPLKETVGLPAGAFLGVFALAVAVVVIRLIVVGQEGQFRQAQRANLEIEKRIAGEQEQRKGLQQANLEIERRVASEQEQREQLQRVLIQVREAASNLDSASREILAATSQQASGAGEQAAAISQASSTIDEVRMISEQSTQRAQGVAEMAQRTAEVSRAGEHAVMETITGMEEVKQKVETIATNILALSEQTQAIGEIIATVNEIATQSNMLALNAAVEAARAGEAGKGFAVVAGEVRSLAEQSRAATVQVKELLSQIQRGVNAAVMATEEGMKGVDAGMKLSGEAGLAIQRLAEGVAGSAQAAAQIAAAAGQQVAGMEQIALAMQNINQVTAQGLASTQQSERAAEELNGLAGKLRQVVEQYRL